MYLLTTTSVITIILLTILLQRVRSEQESLRSVFDRYDYQVPGTEGEIPAENSIVEPPQIAAEYSVTEQELTALRIEYIKNQILKKLRLKQKPTIAFANLPRPVREYGNLIPEHEDHLRSSYSDDFYGKTTQAFIFPYEGTEHSKRDYYYFIRIKY